MWRWFIACAVMCGVALADKSRVVAPATIAPQGTGWYCYGLHNR
jgi:hypothetical protein